jgi:hypothetical protein
MPNFNRALAIASSVQRISYGLTSHAHPSASAKRFILGIGHRGGAGYFRPVTLDTMVSKWAREVLVAFLQEARWNLTQNYVLTFNPVAGGSRGRWTIVRNQDCAVSTKLSEISRAVRTLLLVESYDRWIQGSML